MSRRYTRINPELVPVMDQLQDQHHLTYSQIAQLFGCSRSRVIQLVTKHREGLDAHPVEGAQPA